LELFAGFMDYLSDDEAKTEYFTFHYQ